MVVTFFKDTVKIVNALGILYFQGTYTEVQEWISEGSVPYDVKDHPFLKALMV